MKATNPNWTKLRVWKTSQADAFEELCCQLAHTETVPAGSAFIRNAPPDAGVECFWMLPDGKEWGWQAKFPHTGLSQSLWAELDESVATALSKCPKLTRYFVCLPISFSNARLKGQKSAREKWNKRVAKWTTLAAKEKRQVEFVLWDEHEIWMRLSHADHRGRRMFWFGDTVFDASWFRANVQAAIQQAGDRYDALLNVTVPEAGLFPALARSPEFWNNLNEWAISIREALTKDLRHVAGDAVKNEWQAVRESLSACIAIINILARDESSHLDFDKVAKAIGNVSADCSILRNKQWELERIAYQEYEKKYSRRPEPYENIGPEFSWHSFKEVERRVHKAQNYLNSSATKLVNQPILLFSGEAGSGKTHLLCNAAENFLSAGVPTILLLGEQFHDSEPWGQILSHLGLNCQRDDFLGALDAAAEASGCRTVIIIDALNEGEGLKIWPRHLNAFLSHVNRWPRLSVCLSVRTGYETAILPAGKATKSFVHVSHQGFASLEAEASARFFEHFGIATPSVPVLSPEFANPLFLKLFCRALHNAGLKEVPTGLHGISAIFDFFLETINEKLSKPTALDFDAATRPVRHAVDRLSELMFQSGSPNLPVTLVQAELNQILPRQGYENSLERRLRVEGVLARQMDFDPKSRAQTETVRFTYQRFTDHRIVHVLLKAGQKGKERKLFAKNSQIWSLLQQKGWYWQTQGLWDALAIQLPELFGVELPDILTRFASHNELRQAFLASIIWRNRTAFNSRTTHWLAKYRDESVEGYADVMNTLLTVSTCSGHPFNADCLHNFLFTQKRPDRDVKWSIYLFQEYGEGKSVDRLIDWALSERGSANFDDETARLGATALAWFLTTCHRMVRDRATKALVSLLANKLPVLCGLLRAFEKIDDPYVSERLYAVAFGCALRSENLPMLQMLGQQVYDDIFKSGTPPAHILLRDYAKGVVQTALNHRLKLDCDEKLVIPPYQTKWIGKLPKLDELETHFHGNTSAEEDQGGRRLYHSVTGDDFSRYELNDLQMWTPRRLGKKTKPSPLQIYESFEKALLSHQKKHFGDYEMALWNQSAAKRMTEFKPNAEFQKRELALAAFEKQFAGILPPKLARQFQKVIVPMLRIAGKPSTDEHFKQEILERWILHRAIQLGWTKKRFGAFDGRTPMSGRDAYKPERIGKKYQWIALHEFYARLSDNFEFATDYRSPSVEDRKTGRWTNQFRDIDASLLLRSTPHDGWIVNCDSWWVRAPYQDWFCQPTKLKWLQSREDVPLPERLIQVVNPRDNSEWLLLEGFIKWEYKESVGSLRTREADKQEIWHMYKSYFVTEREFQKVFSWAGRQSWMNRWMPESHHSYRTWLHEHYWPPHFSSSITDDWISEGVKNRDNIDSACPAPILVSNDEYLCEKGTHDCSVDETISITLPCRWLVEKMNLKMRGRHCEFFDDAGTLIAFDPSMRERGPGALLVRKKEFLAFLAQSKHRVFWTFLGEKNLYAPGLSTGYDNWLGRLEMNGAYTFKQNQVYGSFATKFIAGGLTKDSEFEHEH
jgi:hypothetical protein